MLQVILRRLLMSVPLVFVVTFLTFFLNSLAPGDLASTILGADSTREQYEALRTELGLDRPLVMQYLAWLWQAVQGNLGVSFFTSNRSLGAALDLLPAQLSIDCSACFIISFVYLVIVTFHTPSVP